MASYWDPTNQQSKICSPFYSIDSFCWWLGVMEGDWSPSQKFHRKIPCLLQIKIAREETKSGFEWSDLNNILGKDDWQAFEAAPIHGVMGMATFTDDQNQVRTEFALLKTYFETLKSKYFNLNPDFKIISMGMSGDYTIAIEEGLTWLGSAVWSLSTNAPLSNTCFSCRFPIITICHV